MGNSLRCCLGCVLPCGALDLIRVVHINGHVEEYSRQISAAEILRSNPNHVLSQPCSYADGVHRVTVLSPDSDLKRGHIYFLVPDPTEPKEEKRKNKIKKDSGKNSLEKETSEYVVEITSEKRASRRRMRSVRVGVWRPHLQSINEDVYA